MNPFRHRPIRREVTRSYAEEQAAWQLEHGTDRNDLTPTQRQRWRLWVQCVDSGLNPQRVAFARWCVAHAVVTR